jgi:hypothetical protein
MPHTAVYHARKETAMLAAQLILFGASALIALAFGVRYLLASEFMRYHATVAGRSWQQLDSGVQTIVLGMLRIIGAGLITTGVATCWLMLALYEERAWASFGLLTVTLASTVPILYVTIWLRRVQPAARTPVLPAATALAIGVVGAALSLFR